MHNYCVSHKIHGYTATDQFCCFNAGFKGYLVTRCLDANPLIPLSYVYSLLKDYLKTGGILDRC